MGNICRYRALAKEKMAENKQLKAANATLKTEVERLKSLFAPPPAPTVKDKISAQEVRELYEEIFPDNKDKIFLSDTEFKITAISEIRRFVEWDNTDEFGYVKNEHDCDDFAESLAGSFSKYPEWSGYATSDIWGNYLNGHAFFTAVAWPSFEDRTPTVFYVEPQNDHEVVAEMVEGTELWMIAI